MQQDKIEISTDGARSCLKINGMEMSGVRSYKLEHSAGDAPKLHLELNALNATVDGIVLTVLPEIYENFQAKRSEKRER